MNQELRDKRIEYRLSQARESLREADALFQASLLRGAINRAYYAMKFVGDPFIAFSQMLTIPSLF